MPGQLPIYTSAEMSARSRNNDRPRSRIEHKTNSIRKGDTYSPSLFINAMEYVLKTLDWNGRGIDFNGQYISHLRFAEEIVTVWTILQDESGSSVEYQQEQYHAVNFEALSSRLCNNTSILAELSDAAGTTLVGRPIREFVYTGQHMGSLVISSNHLPRNH